MVGNGISPNRSSDEQQIITNEDIPDFIRKFRIGGGVFLFILSIIIGLSISHYTDPGLLVIMSMMGLVVLIVVLFIQYEVRPKAIRLNDKGVVFIFRIRRERLIKWDQMDEFVIDNWTFRRKPYSSGTLLDKKNRTYVLNQVTAAAIDKAYRDRFGFSLPSGENVYLPPFFRTKRKK